MKSCCGFCCQNLLCHLVCGLNWDFSVTVAVLHANSLLRYFFPFFPASHTEMIDLESFSSCTLSRKRGNKMYFVLFAISR